MRPIFSPAISTTFSSGRSLNCSSSQSPLTMCGVPVRFLTQSCTSLHPMFPVHRTPFTLFGVIISRYLPGIYAARIGTWKSPSSNTNVPIYSSSAIFSNLNYYSYHPKQKYYMTEPQNYQQLISEPNNSLIPLDEAISRVLNGRISVQQVSHYLKKKLEKETNEIVWHEEERKEQFLKLCNECQEGVLQTQKKELAMRQTKKNINQVNRQVFKMKKSLTEIGILEEEQKKQNQSQLKVPRSETDERRELDSMNNSGKELQERQNDKAQNQTRKEGEDGNFFIQEKVDVSQNKHESQDIQQDQKFRDKQEALKEERLSHQLDENNRSSTHENHGFANINPEYQSNHSIKLKKTVLQNQQREEKIMKLNFSQEYSQNYIPKQTENNESIYQGEKSQYITKHHGDDLKNYALQSYKSDEHLAEGGRTNEIQAYLIKNENIENQKEESVKQKLKKKKKRGQSPEDLLEKLMNRYQNKVRKVFECYSREMHQSGSTFSQNEVQQHLLDLRIFLKYYKQYELSSYYKVTRVTKLFKKYAINSLWLDLHNFKRIHDEAFHIPHLEDEEISREDKIKSLENLHQSILPDDRVNKTLNKSERINIRSTIEIHSGNYREAMLEKLKQKKEQQERKHRENAAKILERYRKQFKNIKSQSEGKLNPYDKSQLFKINSYSQIKKLKQISVNGSKKKQKTEGKEEQRQKDQTQKLPSIGGRVQVYRQLSLPKLSKRKLRQQSIYETLKLVEWKKQAEQVKKLIWLSDRGEEQYINSYLVEERKRHPSPQNNSPLDRMKFS